MEIKKSEIWGKKTILQPIKKFKPLQYLRDTDYWATSYFVYHLLTPNGEYFVDIICS